MRPRILTLSKPYVASAYRHKLQAIAALGEFEVGLICPPAWGSQAHEADPPGTPPLWTKVLPIVLNGRNHFHLYRGLEGAIGSFRPDLLNIEEEHYSLVTFQALRIARRLGIPSAFYTWQNIAKTYPPPFSWTEAYVLARAEAGICGNHEAAEILRAKGYGGLIAEIPQMGVELEHFAPKASGTAARRAAKQELGLDPERFIILFAGRLVAEKGVSDLLRALQETPALAAAQLLVLGDGPERRALLETARPLGPRCRFVAHVPSRDVARYLRAVDVLCLPSRTRENWKEQFGRILVEAMAAEAIPVGSSSGEIPHVIGAAGLTFPEGDSGALGGVLTRVMQDGELAANLRAEGARRVRALYTNERLAESFAAVFRRLLNGARKPS